MACAHPFRMKNIHFRAGSFNPKTRFPTVDVPCGWCLNCRVDKRNALEDRCNYEYKKFGYGTFLTLTYDDCHIDHLLRKNKKGEVVTTLSKDDCTRFIKRLRSRICRQRINVRGICSNFTYVIVGEYGEKTERCHYHALIFGLDYQVCERLFYDVWGNGNIMSYPIRNGGIRYVLKYMDKQINGVNASKMYDENNLERPFCHKSQSIGVGLYNEQIDYIKSHNYHYKGKHNKDRPLPTYYKNKLLGLTVQDNSDIRLSMSSYNIKPDCKDPSGTSYSLKQINSFSKQKALIREKNLVEMARRDGTSVQSVVTSCTTDFHNLVDVALELGKFGDVVPF